MRFIMNALGLFLTVCLCTTNPSSLFKAGFKQYTLPVSPIGSPQENRRILEFFEDIYARCN